MTTTRTITHDGDTYIIVMKKSIIVSVTRYLGDSALGSTVDFDNLSPLIQYKILSALSYD